MNRFLKLALRNLPESPLSLRPWGFLTSSVSGAKYDKIVDKIVDNIDSQSEIRDGGIV
jgi:hypothetical protein